MQGSLSQICYLRPSSNFMKKNREDLAIFVSDINKKSETRFPAFRPSVHILKNS